MKFRRAVLLLICIAVLVVIVHYNMISRVASAEQRYWRGKYLVGTATAGFQNEEDDMPKSKWASYVHELFPYIKGPNQIDLDVFEHDIQLLKGMGGNTYRFSIEWSRVQPGPVQFRTEYYHRVCEVLKKHSIQPVITLFHFVLPPWAEDVWEHRTGAFTAFACRVVLEFEQYKPIFITLNEPYLYALHGYMLGVRPPFKKSVQLCLNVLTGMLSDHAYIYKFIKQRNEQILVSIAKNIMPVHANTQLNPIEQALRVQFNAWFNLSFFRFVNTGVISMFLMGKMSYCNTNCSCAFDFIGVNHYTEMSMATHLNYSNPIGVELRPPQIGVGSIRSAAGWFVTPLSWYKTLQLVTENTRIPVMVTECGVSNIVEESTIGRADAMANILNLINTFPQVCGVLVWTLIDNIEWEAGTGVRFGVFDIKRNETEIVDVVKSFFRHKTQSSQGKQ